MISQKLDKEVLMFQEMKLLAQRELQRKKIKRWFFRLVVLMK